VFNDLRLEAQFVVFFCVEMLTIIVNFLVFNDFEAGSSICCLFCVEMLTIIVSLLFESFVSVQEQK
jgi:hypothetical protein